MTIPNERGYLLLPWKLSALSSCKKSGRPKFLPGSHQTGGNLLILLRSLRFDVNAMAEKIHHIKGVKLAIIFDIPRTDQVGLVYVIKVQGLGEIGIFNPFGSVMSFF